MVRVSLSVLEFPFTCLFFYIVISVEDINKHRHYIGVLSNWYKSIKPGKTKGNGEEDRRNFEVLGKGN